VEFCSAVGAGGNHVVAATAGGRALGSDKELRLRQRELAAVLEEYERRPNAERTPPLDNPAKAKPPRRPVPLPPSGGLILRGYCTYLRGDKAGKLIRAEEYYYKENPDRWKAETQSDTLWLTAAESKSLIPSEPKSGHRTEVAPAIQRRFYSTIAIDYMEGSVNSLPPRETKMTLTLRQVDDDKIDLRLDGYARLGKELDERLRKEPNSRGCEVRVLGQLRYDRKRQTFDQFDVVGVGQAWGNKMDYVHREIRLESYPWHYGIACELVRGDTPAERIPPYNLLHYGSAGPYFAER
jgi:hypothetical protein